MLREETDTPPSPTAGIVVTGWGSVPHRGVYVAVFLTSIALLALEVSLTRLFSFTVWYHFAYLTISVALLGFGSSGALVAAFPRGWERDGPTRLVAALAAAGLLTVAALCFVARFPLQLHQLTARPLRFLAALLTYYVAIGAPFLLAGFALSVPFAAYPRLMGRLYFWDLLGAALGCLLVVVLIRPLGVPALILSAAAVLIAAAAVLSVGCCRPRTRLALAAAAALLLLLALPVGRRLDIRVTGTKALAGFADALHKPDSYSRWTAINRVDAFNWDPPTQFLYWRGTGIWPGYAGPFPEGAWLQYDAGNGSNIYAFHGSFTPYAMLEHHLLRTPYIVVPHPNVLVIGVGGGIDLINAIYQGARHVTGIELQPETVSLLKDRLHDFTGGFYDRPDVTLRAGEGRHYVRQSRETFDLIQITAVDTFAAQAVGAYVLAESYLYTVDAIDDYLSHISDAGLLSMVVGDFREPQELPPLATRLGVTAFRALQRRGVEHPERHLMVIAAVANGGGAQSQNVLVKPTPFTKAQVDALAEFARVNGFMVLYAPAGLADEPFSLSGVLGADERIRRQELDAARYRMDAVYDDDPFFYNVGKWKNLSPTYGLLYLFPGSFIGQMVLLAMLAQSMLLGVALIALPLSRGVHAGVPVSRLAAHLAYFLALGVGFMFIEISFVQSFVLFLGSPTYALSLTIFALLLFSSLGSRLSSRYVDHATPVLRRLAVLLPLVVILYAVLLGPFFGAFLHLDLWVRVLLATLVQMPLGVLLGMFMPLGIACAARVEARLVPWAWGMNGIGSVAGTTLAVLLAMAWGFKVVALCAAGLYLLGTMLLLRFGIHPTTDSARSATAGRLT